MREFAAEKGWTLLFLLRLKKKKLYHFLFSLSHQECMHSFSPLYYNYNYIKFNFKYVPKIDLKQFKRMKTIGYIDAHETISVTKTRLKQIKILIGYKKKACDVMSPSSQKRLHGYIKE